MEAVYDLLLIIGLFNLIWIAVILIIVLALFGANKGLEKISNSGTE
jgi:ABC-type amino acid transport system permease subunit